jgi:hypothetical protein
MDIQRAVFLRGVSDPADIYRVTTTLFRPKHADLRVEDGFVVSGNIRVPLSNVVELRAIDAPPAEATEPAEAGGEVEDVASTQGPKRRGRPRKQSPDGTE